ncbi:MAG: penicillin-binding transpeptidase domain-containing protein, partial [Oscillospiraceae bacterium]
MDKNTTQNITMKWMRMRTKLIMVIISFICFFLLISRIFYIQIIESEKYRNMAIKQQMKTVAVPARRGTIYDRNMTPLAESATVWNICISPFETTKEQIPVIKDELEKLFELDPKVVDKAIEKKQSKYERLVMRVDRAQMNKVLEFVQKEKITGLWSEEATKRYYPYGNLASTVIGFTNIDNDGAYGIEAYYNDVLTGVPGRVMSSQKNPEQQQQMFEAQDGNSLVLTIDETIQQFVEKHLETAVLEYDVKKRATTIVMNVKTGEILAMATKPDFDPNNPRKLMDPKAIEILGEFTKDSDEYKTALGDLQFAQWRNKAISDPYEPGSVYKILTTSMALETNKATVNTHFNCVGFHKVADRTIKCWKRGGHGDQDFTKGLMNSCNPIFMIVGANVGGEATYDYFEAFGLTETTGIDIPGEVGSIYHSKKTLKNGPVQLAVTSFGQTFKVTPIQLITGISAAVNGGNLMQPYVVKQVIDSNSNIIKSKEPISKRQIVSEKTSEIVRQMCEKVVSEGTGRTAYVPGYKIGGKTGTSEKLDEKVNDQVQGYVLSFLGFAPADDPEIAILTLLDEMTLHAQGSQTAAPVVGAMMADILPYLGIESQFTEEELEHKEVYLPD